MRDLLKAVSFTHMKVPNIAFVLGWKSFAVFADRFVAAKVFSVNIAIKSA